MGCRAPPPTGRWPKPLPGRGSISGHARRPSRGPANAGAKCNSRAWGQVRAGKRGRTQSKHTKTQTKHSQTQIGPKRKSAEGGGAKHTPKHFISTSTFTQPKHNNTQPTHNKTPSKPIDTQTRHSHTQIGPNGPQSVEGGGAKHIFLPTNLSYPCPFLSLPCLSAMHRYKFDWSACFRAYPGDILLVLMFSMQEAW